MYIYIYLFFFVCVRVCACVCMNFHRVANNTVLKCCRYTDIFFKVLPILSPILSPSANINSSYINCQSI